ncbi:MAG TPA: helix-turn-helix domain-containing protein [Baekduia sp.]|nr:helix-turn-helix domain-containing protein [Baekduia sp.]
MTAADVTAIDALLRRVAADNGAALTELTGLILERLREAVPEFFADEDVAFDMAAAVAANVRRVHRLLAEDAPRARSDVVAAEAGDLLQTTLQHGIPLISLLEAYRSAQSLATDWWQRRLERDAPPRLLPAATRALHQRIVAYIDAASVEIRTSYELERRALESSPDGRRAHLVRKLLSGEPLDVDAAARTLNHPLTGRHVALVLWREGDDRDDEALETTLAAIHAAVPAARLLSTSARHRVYAWLSTHGALDVRPALALPTAPGVRVAMSGLHAGVDGFVRAHVEATQTAAIVRDRPAGAGQGRIAVFERFELLAFFAREREDTARFVQRALGPLAADTPQAARARETLWAYLAAGASATRAARRLGVHRNTVGYRLQAVADLLAGLQDDDANWQARATRRLEVELALLLAHELGTPLTDGA